MEAIEKSAMVARGTLKAGRGIGTGVTVLELLEGANKGDMLNNLDDDELRRLQNMLFVWNDIATLELISRGKR